MQQLHVENVEQQYTLVETGGEQVKRFSLQSGHYGCGNPFPKNL